ncbi:MAG TPA: Gldg family protein [Chakrabartia sp.]|nr:Gldg family protein [Chakrabartia sp.]
MLLAALALHACGAAPPDWPQRRVALMSALPLYWGEAGPDAILNGNDQRAPLVPLLEQHHRLTPVDVLDRTALSRVDLVVLAQPRILQAEELVALDDWVRGGGHALIFADPELVWESGLPLGDPRRAPPVTLLDPLLTHWGLTLEPDDSGAAVPAEGYSLSVARRGRWRAKTPGCTVEADALLAHCTLGKGRATLVADADALNLEVITATDQPLALLALIDRAAR